MYQPTHPMSQPDQTENALSTTRGISMSAARVLAMAAVLLLTAVVGYAAEPPYKDRRVVDVLREFQKQGVRIVFSTALVRPDMRIAAEPADGGDRRKVKVIAAILAPHGLVAKVGPRGVLLVVRAPRPPQPQ